MSMMQIRISQYLLKYLDNVESIEYKKPTLNDVFLQIAGGSLDNDDSPEGGFHAKVCTI